MKNAVALPEAVIWDWDNTLVATWVKTHNSMNAAFRHLEMPE